MSFDLKGTLMAADLVLVKQFAEILSEDQNY